MNLLKGTADADSFNVGPSLPLPATAPRNGDLILGLRPEHTALGAAEGSGWPMTVEMVEMLGAERLVHGRVGDTLFTVRIDGTLVPPKVADRVSLQMDAGHIHWFDARTQQRVQT